MDPILTPSMLSAALTKLLDALATDAGSKAWDAFKALVTRHRGKAPAQPSSAEDVSALAEELASAAETDQDLAQALTSWCQTIAGSGNLVLTVNAPVKTVIQGKDFSNGTFTFNG